MPDFRSRTPTRTCNSTFTTHRRYKGYLVTDFANRCGYCDGHDSWYGGYRYFHVDHFAPQDKFPALKAVYSNLIYSCPSCNNAKSNKWPSNDPSLNIVNNKGFLNPVTDDINGNFERDEFGNIIGRTQIANDMIINLNLDLERHGVLWMLSELDAIIKKYKDRLDTNKLDSKLRKKFEEALYNLLKIFHDWQDMLKLLNS